MVPFEPPQLLIFFYLDADPYPALTLMRIWIGLFILIRIRIRLPKMMRIRICDPRETMWFSPERIETKQTHVSQNFARFKENEKNSPTPTTFTISRGL
jgi:hypothetical protein